MLLKVIKRICDKNPELQELIDPSVLICAEEGVSTEHVFFFILLFFDVVFIVIGCLDKRVEDINFCVCERNIWKFQGSV